MPYYGSGGMFGGGINNPQYVGNPFDQNMSQSGLWNQWQRNQQSADLSHMADLYNQYNPGNTPFDPFGTMGGMAGNMNQMAQMFNQYNPGGAQFDPLGTIGMAGQQGYGAFDRFALHGPGGTAFSLDAPAGGTGQWNASFDPGALGMGGGFGFNPWDSSGGQFTPWGGGDYQAPGPWDIGGSSAAPYSDYSMQAIEANIPYLQEQMDQRMADAGARAGASGFAMSTPYTDSLGAAGRGMQEDLNRIAMDYRTRAASEQAMMEQQAQQNYYDRLYGRGAALAGMQHQGGLADLANQFGAWQQQNMWNQAGLDRDYGAWALQNQLGYNQWALGQNMLQNLLGGLMPDMNIGMNFGG